MTLGNDWNKPANGKWLSICSTVLIAVTLTLCGGCATLNHCSSERCTDTLFGGWRDYVWAQRAFHQQYPSCNHAHADHFRKGFCAGYSAVCNGEDTYVPAVPPKEYWGYTYQSADGNQMVAAWFEGYPEGVRAATSDGAGSYRDVQVSRMLGQALQQTNDSWGSTPPSASGSNPPIVAGQSIQMPPAPETRSPGFVLGKGLPTDSLPHGASIELPGSAGSPDPNTPLSINQSPFSWGQFRNR